MSRGIAISSIAVVAACMGAPVDAAVFADRSQFVAASSGLQLIDFEGLPPVPHFGALTLDGVAFVGFNGVIPASTGHIGYQGPGTALVNIGVPEISSIQVTLPRGVTAIGADLLILAPDNRTPVSVVLSDGQFLTLSGDPLPSRSFVGFTSDIEIASLLLHSSGGGVGVASRIGLDDVVFGMAQPIPEPVPAALWLGGLLLIGIQRAHRKA
jgi:hypothetical protein